MPFPIDARARARRRPARHLLLATLLPLLPSTLASAQGPPDGVSLTTLLEHAARHAPALDVAVAHMALARAERRAAQVALPDDPELSVAAGPRVAPEGVGVDFQVSVGQRLEIAGERGLRRALAVRRRDRLAAELRSTGWSVHQVIHATFHEALVARRRAAVARALLEFQQELLRVARRRVAAGDTSPLDERLALAEVGQARQERIEADRIYRSLCLRLAEVSGWSAPAPPEPAGDLDEARPPPPLEQLLALAREHHPELAVRRAALAEAEARARLEDRERWPEPTVGVSVGREAGIGAEAGQWTILGNLSVPLPFTRQSQGERARARAAVTVASAELEALRRALVARLSRLAGDVASAAERLAAYGEDILPRFDDNLRMLQRAFDLGEIDLLQLSVARERFLRIELAALDAFGDYFDSVAALEAAIGVDPWPDAHDHDHGPAGAR